MKISPRFVLDTFAVVAGAFLVVASLAFTSGVAGWLAFGVSTAVLVAALAAMLGTGRRDARIGHGVLGMVGLWSLIAALVFAAPVLVWLVFADAIAVALVGLVDLAVHEAHTERVVHELDVRTLAKDAVPTN